MQRHTLGRGAALLAALLITLGGAPAVFADGEIGDVGDTDSITDLQLASSHVRAKIDYVHDCPTGMNCAIEVNFQYKCPEAWCLGWSSQGWKTIPAPVSGVSTATALCNGGDNVDNYWQMQYRVHWWASTKTTTTLSGEVEAFVGTNGTIGYRLIAEAGYNESLKAGMKAGTIIETVSATSDYSPVQTIATSGGKIYHTC
jgi:hypothetical protein